MTKIKYRFNPESLSFDKIHIPFKRKLLKMLPHLLGVTVGSVLLFIAFNYFFDSPKERVLIRENQSLLTQYELLNKQIEQLTTVLKDIQERDDNVYRVIFEAEPIPSSVRKAGFGGVNRYEKFEGLHSSDLIIETTQKVDHLTKQLYVQSKSYDEIEDLVKNKDKFLLSIPAIQPLSVRDHPMFSSGFGYRMHPIYGSVRFHSGVDLVAKLNAKVYATGSGIVVTAGTGDKGFSGYGKAVVIDHGFGFKTIYGHLNKISVRVGQKIVRGEIIGGVGSTGRSVGVHLHYEVRRHNKPVNPINYYFQDLTPQEYDEMVRFSLQASKTLD